MNRIKRNIIILIGLLLLMLSLLAFQLTPHTSVDNRHTMAVNMQNLDEEIKLIEQVSREVLTHLQIDTSIVENPLPAPVSALPQRLRDPFTFPDELILEKAKRDAASQKTKKEDQKPKIKPNQENPKLVFKLVGIIFDKVNPMAIINGEVYKEGDLINNFRVEQITKEGVELISGNDHIFLKKPEFD